LIEAEAHTSGLTNKIKNKLYLAIDGELPPEEVEEAEEEFVLEKPKLQNFKEELEQEEKEELEQKEEEQEQKEEEKKDKPDIGEVIEEFKRKNKSKNGSLSLSDNSNNSFILNNK
jgi:exosome complex component RRP4